MRRGVLPAAAALVLLLGACGDDDDADEREEEGSTQVEEEGGDTGLLDPCTLFDEAALTDAFGAPGEATGASVDPSRRVCTYASGTIVGVATANQYGPSVSQAQAAGAACDPVAGVGEEATFCTTFGQVGQLLWVEGDVAYDLTALSTERDPFTELARSVGG